MKAELKNFLSFPSVDRFAEETFYNQNLQAVSLFPYTNLHARGILRRLVLNFSFRDIDFSKKKALPFFLATELLTKQKCIATLSSRNLASWKLRKGMLVGCKVTLRKQNLEDFFDSLLLALPRMEKFRPLSKNFINKEKTASFAVSLSEIVFFYPMELGLGINSDVKRIEIHLLFNTTTAEEKIFLLRSKKIPVDMPVLH
jgi:large subunit ribosomal protein L5